MAEEFAATGQRICDAKISSTFEMNMETISIKSHFTETQKNQRNKEKKKQATMLEKLVSTSFEIYFQSLCDHKI